MQLNAVFINELNIDCNSNYSCKYSSFSIESTSINQFNLSCTSTGCSGMDIAIGTASINSLLWRCSDTISCEQSTLNLGDDITIDVFKRECNGLSSCYNSSIISTENGIIDTLELECSSTGSCGYFEVNAQIRNATTIQCTAFKSCQEAQVSVTAITADVNYIVNCANPSGSLENNGSCFNSDFTFYGYGESTNLSIECGEYDCYAAYFNGYDINKVAINCNYPC